MRLHSKHPGFFLVLGLAYLTMCPHSAEVTAGLFEYTAIGCKIQSLEQKTYRDSHSKTPHTMAEIACGGNTDAVDSAYMLCRAYENHPRTKNNPLAGIKLLL